MPFRVITAKGGEITPAIIRPKIRDKWLYVKYKKMYSISEIRQWMINRYTSPMMINKTTPFCRLKLVIEKFDTPRSEIT